MTPLPELPDYDSLPHAPAGGRSAWHLFGPTDNLGLINLQTADRVLAAAACVKRGAVFSLNAPIDFLSYPLFGRGTARREWRSIANIEFDDHLDNFYLQGSSQWDSLGHFGAQPGAFYNGATLDEVGGGRRNTIEHWARRGIAGRALLLDVARALEQARRPFTPGNPYEITVEDLELAREMAHVSYQVGDILLIRTGYLAWYSGLSDKERQAMAAQDDPPSAGLQHSEAIARYIWNSHVSAVASDNTSVEVTPADLRPDAAPFGLMHTVLIGRFGLALGELWFLDSLAEDCLQSDVYESLLISSPLNIRGGFGSPANAVAIK